ncbi:hypothetical protein B0O99DRAFT_118204 [Bisporella sp. PMI_857]|nr:hypothetical protein B0O99DRAFT_118204 [Bisporella sp. PMI_857]
MRLIPLVDRHKRASSPILSSRSYHDEPQTLRRVLTEQSFKPIASLLRGEHSRHGEMHFPDPSSKSYNVGPQMSGQSLSEQSYKTIQSPLHRDASGRREELSSINSSSRPYYDEPQSPNWTATKQSLRPNQGLYSTSSQVPVPRSYHNAPGLHCPPPQQRSERVEM